MLLTLLAATLSLLLEAPSARGDGAYEVDAEKVYLGDPEAFKEPATVDRDKVFGEIPAYKLIQKEGLTEKHARYWILLQKANEVFEKVITKVAGDGGYDLVAENGAVRPKGKTKKTPPDVTQDAINAIKDVAKDE